MNNNDVAEKTKEQLLMKAAKFMQDGFDPIEELYHEAKELGFTGKTQQQEAPAKEKEEEIKPDMKKLAANRVKSTGMAAASGGRSQPSVSAKAAGDLSVAEFSRLTRAEKQAIYAQLAAQG
jgi:hypothetical protein